MSDLSEAQELYRECIDAHAEQRRQIAEDLRFSDPSDPQQWEETVKKQRESDPGGKRPCLVMDQCGQYVANVAGQIEKQPPSLHAIPVSGGADKQAAEQIDGRFRHIEHASRAQQHYARALTSAARSGVGYIIIRPEYVNKDKNYQEPRIGSEADPLRVVLDPWSVETDGSDAEYGFILTPMSLPGFERKWKGKDPLNFGDEGQVSEQDRKSVWTVEYWHKQDGKVKWCRMSGADVLDESVYPASAIGIVPVYGYVGFSDGRMRYCGIPRRARYAQQAYNYHVSEQLAYIGTAPKSPWLASTRAIAGHETLWDKASVETRAFLPYNDQDEYGPINVPSRVNVASNLVNHESGAAQALRDIQASIGMYQANLGAESNETSGVAIESRKQQGEASTAHFPAHMAASLGQVGKIVMEMDARLADTKRTQPIIGVDQSPGNITVDPKQEKAFARGPDGVTVNPNVGQYGVRVVVGASYSTQRTQTNAAFAEIMRGNKELAAVVAPFWAQTLDFPGSDKFAQAMAAMAPAPVKAILQPEGQDNGPDPAAMAQELDQCKQALQEAIQHAQAAQEDADQAIQEVADAKRLAEVKERELDIKAYDSETNRLKVTGANEAQIKAITEDLINQMLSQPDPLPGDTDETGMDPALRPQPEVEEPMPPEPPGPSPELTAIQDTHGRLGNLEAMLQELAALARKSRKRVPVRDKQGNIVEVIDSIAED